MPLEAAVLNRARRNLERLGYSHFIKTSGEGEPDLVGCVNGRSVVCECKQPGETPTPLQMTRLMQWHTSGAIALWTDDAEHYHRFGVGDSRPATLAELRAEVRR